MTAIRFCTEGYRSVITRFLDAGYRTVEFGRDSYIGPQLILRHDVDVCLDHAVAQAAVNRELGISATFFVLVSADFYNLANSEGRLALERLRENGQKIGLHFDASIYPGDQDLEPVVEAESSNLASFLGESPAAVSFHRPARSLLGRVGNIGGLPSAYDPKYFDAMEYCSDSRGAFLHGEPFDRAAFKEGTPFQLLLHPLWWMREEEKPPLQVLDDFLDARAAQDRKRMAANSSLFATG